VWLSESAKETKRLRQRLERRWKSKGNKNDYVEYRRACRAANNEIITARSNFYKDRITEAAGDPRRRWSVIRDILHLTEVKAYHTPDDCRKLADAFSTFFVDKIRKTKELIKARRSVHDSIPLQHDKPAANSNLPLDELQPPSIDEVFKSITNMSGKSSPIDSIPTSIIKSCADVFAPLIAHLAKLSFAEVKFPTRYKTASITPLLKKKESDPQVTANYRPVSNLHTISKIRRYWSDYLCHVFDHTLKILLILTVFSHRTGVHIPQRRHC